MYVETIRCSGSDSLHLVRQQSGSSEVDTEVPGFSLFGCLCHVISYLDKIILFNRMQPKTVSPSRREDAVKQNMHKAGDIPTKKKMA